MARVSDKAIDVDDTIAIIKQNEGVSEKNETSEIVTARERVEEETVVARTTTLKGKRSKRITLNVIDGKLDLSKTPEPQVKLLSEAISATPESHDKLALPKPKETAVMPESICKMAIQLTNSLERLVAVTAIKVPSDIAYETLTLTTEQEELLLTPTKKVMEKYIPASALEYSPEAELCMALLVVGQQHYAACVKAMQERRKQHTSPSSVTTLHNEQSKTMHATV